MSLILALVLIAIVLCKVGSDKSKAAAFDREKSKRDSIISDWEDLYVDEEEILSKITGLMGKYGVSLIPNITHGSAVVEPYHYTKTKATKDGKTYEEHINEVMVRADMDWIWVNDENPEDRVVVPWLFVGSQSDASQAFGSALTYASRYFLLKYFNVATSADDPDNWRSRQREAENQEDRLIAEKIVDQIHKLVTDHLAANPDDKQMCALMKWQKRQAQSRLFPAALAL